MRINFIIFSSLMNDDLARSEDGFDALCDTLPQVTRRYRPDVHRASSWRDEKFQNWLISRFDRTSETTLLDLLTLSIPAVRARLGLHSFLYLLILVISWLLFSHNLLFLGVIFFSMSSLLSLCLMLSFRTRTPFLEIVMRLLTKNGFLLMLGICLMNVLRLGLFLGLFARSSATSFFLIAVLACEFVFIFVPPLALDEVRLSPSQVLFFSFRVATASPSLVLKVLFLTDLFLYLSPLTFGVTFFLAHSIRLNLFFTRCGAASPPRA